MFTHQIDHDLDHLYPNRRPVLRQGLVALLAELLNHSHCSYPTVLSSDVFSIGPPTRNTYLPISGEHQILFGWSNARPLSYMRFIIH